MFDCCVPSTWTAIKMSFIHRVLTEPHMVHGVPCFKKGPNFFLWESQSTGLSFYVYSIRPTIEYIY